ncbi:MAG: hypothetical protein HYY13_05320 [Nitrospirae bacterium]|nr:hypothetical protein [Nitrospirota bacterium]
MRLIVLAGLFALIAGLAVITRTGALRPWALRMLDRPPDGPTTVASQFGRKVQSDWSEFEVTFLPFRGGTIIQYDAKVGLVGRDGAVLNPPTLKGVRRMWHQAGFTSEQAIEGVLEGPPSQDGRLHLEQAGRFSLTGVPGRGEGDGAVWPLLEVAWHEGERPSSLRSYPVTAHWTHALRGIEEAILFTGPASVWWPRVSTASPEQGHAFYLRKSGTADPYFADALEGGSESSEWVVLGQDAWLFWHRITDSAGRPLIARGCGRWEGTSLDDAEVDWNPPLRKGQREEPVSGIPRVVRLSSDRASAAYRVDGASSATFGDGTTAYAFTCNLLQGRAGADRCHGAGIRRVLRGSR